MAFFIVSMSHPDEEAWSRYIQAHMDYLKKLLAEGTLRASGKIVDATVKTGCMILVAQDRTGVEKIIARDPFSINGVVTDLRVMEWDPFVGIFSAESSGQVPGQA